MRLKKTFIYAYIFVLSPNIIWANEIFNCRGDLIVLGLKEGASLQLNSSDYKNFSIDRDKYLSISITMDGKNALAMVYPWNGVHFNKMKYANDNSISVTYNTDGEHWFEIQAKKDTNTKSLACKFQEF